MYVELHCKTNFSFLEGASHADELFARAARLGYAALAITDSHSLSGIVRAHVAAKQHGLRLIVGAEIAPRDGLPIVLWATDREAYGRLCRLLTTGNRRAAKGSCELTCGDLEACCQGLLAGVLFSAPQLARAVAGSDDPEGPEARDDVGFCEAVLRRYRKIFGDRCYGLISLHRGADDARCLEGARQWAAERELPLAAAGQVRYHAACRKPLHDALTAIRRGIAIDAATCVLDANAQYHLRSLEELHQLFAAAPSLLERTREIAERCTFSLDDLRYEYPSELQLIDQEGDSSWLPPPASLSPSGPAASAGGSDPATVRRAPRRSPATAALVRPGFLTARLVHGEAVPRPLFACLVRLTERGAAARWPAGVPERVRGQLEHELELIEQLQFEAYFLTVWDLVRFARQRGILCQGRGSAANSAVCYCLGVTSVDPARCDLLFERFVSRERDEAPDIDIDFEHERREEVLQYLYKKYGRERAGMTAEVITYRPRSAVRDLGKALGFSLDAVDALAKNLEGYREEPELTAKFRMSGIDPESPRGKLLAELTGELVGFPRHLSQHVGGMVITDRPLCELAPIENAAMEDRTVIAWDKNDLDALGILKVDCLSLGMLTAIRKAFELIDRQIAPRGTPPLSLAGVPPEDPRVYEMICAADTTGVFQIESRAQMSMLPRLQPRTFYDLVIEVAIVRPGPIQGEMVHPYLRRRNGEEPVDYPNDEVRSVLQKTLGVPLFQEQAMRLAVVAAGFTPGEADQLRRAMGAWRKSGVIEQFRLKMLQGMRARGLSEEFAERLFNQLRGFGEYGFPESHAASFALLVYVSAWLKCHYPAAFAAALLNSQPMGFYAPAQLVRNARDHGVRVLPVDVNHSDWDCTLEESANAAADSAASSLALRLGFRMLAGMSRPSAERIVQARHEGPFVSVENLARRAALPQAAVEHLAAADALASLAGDRRTALWNALDQPARPEDLPLFADQQSDDPAPWALPAMSPAAEVAADYRTAGLSLRGHPLGFYRRQLDALGVAPAESLARREADRPASVAGLVLMRQRPSTAKGITFITLEDETGTANLVVRLNVWQRHYLVARRSSALVAWGTLERKGSVIHLVADRLADLTECLQQQRLPPRPPQEMWSHRSRDFR